eukprot:TRINITY_DN28373_c0_g1_i1.p1 TRINITY_DN28373_c0_g1~~TRINITY_DN28373_c0_g1_i1.p1  ORF type:complete len:476 (+),score=62.27 TRINITY_DN28373_c0_g1_i1:33-1430(+)
MDGQDPESHETADEAPADGGDGGLVADEDENSATGVNAGEDEEVDEEADGTVEQHAVRIEISAERLQQLQDLLARIDRVEARIEGLPEQVREQAATTLHDIRHVVGIVVMSGQVQLDLSGLGEHVDNLEQSFEIIRSWPKDPVQQEGFPEPNTTTYFEHPTEGRIKLQWTNPLPTPNVGGSGYQCDMCAQEDVRVAWQHVSTDGSRDSSTFVVHRVGWDMCFACVRDLHCTERRRLDHFMAVATGACPPDTPLPQDCIPTVPFLYRDPAPPPPPAPLYCVAPHRTTLLRRADQYNTYSIQIIAFQSIADQRARITVEASLAGEHLCCLVTTGSTFPTAEKWRACSVEFVGDIDEPCVICSEKLSFTADGGIRTIRTVCNHAFHEGCLRKSLRGLHGKHPTVQSCPLCRRESPLAGELALATHVVDVVVQVPPIDAGRPLCVVCLLAGDPADPLHSYSIAGARLFP